MKEKNSYLKALTSALLLAAALSAFGTVSRAQVSGEEKRAIIIKSFKDPSVMFKWVKGKWRFESGSCDSDYFLIDVPDPGKIIRLVVVSKNEKTGELENSINIYRVTAVGSYYLRTKIEGEQRLTKEGKPVEWDFMFVSEDEFMWHRLDWPGLNSTPPVVRCFEEKNLAGAR